MKIDKKTIFIWLFSIISIIDSINGYLIQVKHFESDIGLIYRLTVIMYLLYVIFVRNTKKRIAKLLFISSYFITICLFTSFNLNGALGRNLDLTMKLLFPILTIEAFTNMLANNQIGKQDIKKIFDINAFLFPLTVFIPNILGIGLSVYRDGSGIKGFYKSNNELNIVLVILTIYSLNALLKSSKKGKYVIMFLLNIVTLVLIGSKTSYITIALIFLVYLIKELKKIKIKRIILILVILCGAFFIFKLNSEEIYRSIDRQIYKINNYETINFLLSDRNELLEDSFEFFKENDVGALNILWGVGPYKINNFIGQKMGRSVREIEMDLFDTIFYYGIIGGIIVISYYSKFLTLYRKKCLDSDSIFGYKFALIIVFFFSFLAGHVLYSALAGSFLAIICCGIISERCDGIS